MTDKKTKNLQPQQDLLRECGAWTTMAQPDKRFLDGEEEDLITSFHRQGSRWQAHSDINDPHQSHSKIVCDSFRRLTCEQNGSGNKSEHSLARTTASTKPNPAFPNHSVDKAWSHVVTEYMKSHSEPASTPNAAVERSSALTECVLCCATFRGDIRSKCSQKCPVTMVNAGERLQCE
jgi:hypothetical protein